MISDNTIRLQERLREERIQLDVLNKIIENKNGSLIINITASDESTGVIVSTSIKDDTNNKKILKIVHEYLLDIIYSDEQFLNIIKNIG